MSQASNTSLQTQTIMSPHHHSRTLAINTLAHLEPSIVFGRKLPTSSNHAESSSRAGLSLYRRKDLAIPIVGKPRHLELGITFTRPTTSTPMQSIRSTTRPQALPTRPSTRSASSTADTLQHKMKKPTRKALIFAGLVTISSSIIHHSN